MIFFQNDNISTVFYDFIKLPSSMRVNNELLRNLHLDKQYSLLTGRNVKVIHDFFVMLDIHEELALNDVQFCVFLRTSTDLTKKQIMKVFDMLDTDCSGR